MRLYSHQLGRGGLIGTVRQFYSSGANLKAKASAKLQEVNEKLAQLEQAQKCNLDDASLAYKPELWKGLPRETIVRLHQQRVIAMGKNYERTQDELDALLSTAEDPVEAAFIQRAFYETEADQFMEAGQNVDPLADSDETGEPFQYDEYPTVAQDIVRDFRDQLEFNRKAAYELPQLAKFRKPYVPVSHEEQPVVFKYTKYLGEDHPAERKVVLELKVADLKLKDAAAHKFKLLAGPRYNHHTDVFVMSSDRYLEAAQNQSYLSQILLDLIKESKASPKEFADLPLDTRHTDAYEAKRRRKARKTYKFPQEWERLDEKEKKLVDLGDLSDFVR